MAILCGHTKQSLKLMPRNVISPNAEFTSYVYGYQCLLYTIMKIIIIHIIIVLFKRYFI